MPDVRQIAPQPIYCPISQDIGAIHVTARYSISFKASLHVYPLKSEVNTAPLYRNSLLVLYYMVFVFVDENLSFVHSPTMNMIKSYKGTRRLRHSISRKMQQKGKKAYRHKNDDELEEKAAHEKSRPKPERIGDWRSAATDSFTRLRLAHVSRFYAIFSSLILTQSQINIHVFR